MRRVLKSEDILGWRCVSIPTRGECHHDRMVNKQHREILTCQMIITGDSSIYSLHLELRLWVSIRVINHGGREQSYKSRDMVSSDSGLGRLLVIVKDIDKTDIEYLYKMNYQSQLKIIMSEHEYLCHLAAQYP